MRVPFLPSRTKQAEVKKASQIIDDAYERLFLYQPWCPRALRHDLSERIDMVLGRVETLSNSAADRHERVIRATDSLRSIVLWTFGCEMIVLAVLGLCLWLS